MIQSRSNQRYDNVSSSCGLIICTHTHFLIMTDDDFQRKHVVVVFKDLVVVVVMFIFKDLVVVVVVVVSYLI